MSNPQTKASGTRFTQTFAFLAMALIFSPALFILSGRYEPATILTAVAGSAICLLLARVSWTKHSRLTVPTIETAPVPRTK